MNKSPLLAVFLSLFLLPGCGILPKKVEYFQKHVKAVPELSDAGKEHQKAAADYLARKTTEAKDAAIRTQAAPEVLAPVTDANTVAQSLSGSLGKPTTPATNAPASAIAGTLDHDSNKLSKAIDRYREKVEPLVGKAIEGTGFLQLGYFTNLGLLLLVPCLIWVGLKIYGMVNPVVGIGTNIVGRVASSTLALGVRQLAKGGEAFKEYLAAHPGLILTKAQVLELFSRAHVESQDEHVGELVKSLTK